MQRKRKTFNKKAYIISGGTAVGQLEEKSPLREYFDLSCPESKFNMDTWEKAEAEMIRRAAEIAVKKAKISYEDVDLSLAGDLVNQCTESVFGLKEMSIPHVGIYGACSTFALSLGLGATAIESETAKTVLCTASSHFATAERQYRFPLEYGCQRTPSAQTTVTGAGSVILSSKREEKPYVDEFLPGIITDYGVKDTSNMGAAMAPACANTLIRYFQESNNKPSDFDMILTGDLGREGRKLMLELCFDSGLDLRDNASDCGTMIFPPEAMDVGEGGSGCGCSAVVVSSYILQLFEEQKIRDLLFIGTGALLNASTPLQKETIPGIAHLVRIKKD